MSKIWSLDEARTSLAVIKDPMEAEINPSFPSSVPFSVLTEVRNFAMLFYTKRFELFSCFTDSADNFESAILWRNADELDTFI